MVRKYSWREIPRDSFAMTLLGITNYRISSVRSNNKYDDDFTHTLVSEVIVTCTCFAICSDKRLRNTTLLPFFQVQLWGAFISDAKLIKRNPTFLCSLIIPVFSHETTERGSL